MVTGDRRVRIITGFYGSGKSEFALNYALALAKEQKQVAFADLDVVNTYFRSRQQKKLLLEQGLRVFSSSLEDSNTDLPALSPNIMGPLQDKRWQYVIDLGGSTAGMLALGWLKPYLVSGEIDYFLVVNFNRPETYNVSSVLALVAQLENYGSCKITGLINNTNLLKESTVENLLWGQAMLLKASEASGIPLKYTAVWEDLQQRLPQEKIVGQILPLKLYLRLEWM